MGAEALNEIIVGQQPLTAAQLLAIARLGTPVRAADNLDALMAPAAALVDELSRADSPVYGINTGFGALADTRIAPAQARQLQSSLLRSHAAATGPPLPAEVVRAMMAIRAATLARGNSGARPVVVRRIIEMLNLDLVPAVPAIGSLGASGDLAQLAHVFITLLGEGSFLDGRTLASVGLEPLELAAKEGLALTNGTDGMLAMGILVGQGLDYLLKTADLVAGLSVEALLGTDRAFAERVHALRPHPGQVASAANLRRVLAGSEVVASHHDSHHAVQDAYSLRCTPQVHGACRDLAAWASEVFERELASTIDNPVVFAEAGDVVSAGNFHGEPLAFAHDTRAMVLAELASISERRVNRLLDRNLSHGLPAFLSQDSGLNSGLMLTQYTSAALVTELRLLANPASIHSIATSAEQEDHVSMGWTAALKCGRGADLCARVLGIELIAACQGLELRAPLRPGPAGAAVLEALRARVPFLGPDRALDGDIEAAAELVRDGSILRAAEAAIGVLE
ncbi:MAG: histidine ammonia-lyase [Candidatus Dormibacteria bacterium]